MNKLRFAALLMILLFTTSCGWLHRYKKPGRRKHSMGHVKGHHAKKMIKKHNKKNR